MFTGIVEELGAVESLQGTRLGVSSRKVAADAQIGDSIAVNGVCLTVVTAGADALGFDVSRETLERTSLRRLVSSAPVNLERPVTLLSRLGGHLVQGHVDGVAEIVAIEPDPQGGCLMIFRLPESLLRYVVEKGSITVDGVSLTLSGISGSDVTVALIPHTLEVTTLGTVVAGDPVNIEVDIIAKYVERLNGGQA